MYGENFSLEFQEHIFLHGVALKLEFPQVSFFHGCFCHLKEVSQGSQVRGGGTKRTGVRTSRHRGWRWPDQVVNIIGLDHWWPLNCCLSSSPAPRLNAFLSTPLWWWFFLGPQERQFQGFPPSPVPPASSRLIQVFLQWFYFILQIFKFTYGKIHCFWCIVLWIGTNAYSHVTITEIKVRTPPPMFSHATLMQFP